MREDRHKEGSVGVEKDEPGNTMGKLLNKVAIITGAAQGIGKGIARVYGDEGAIIVLLDF